MRSEQVDVVFAMRWTGFERFLGPEGLEGLRKPLWTIMASTHALQRSPGLGPRGRRLVDRIDAAVERLLTVVRDLADGHELQKGRPLPLLFRATDVRGLASRVVAAARVDHPDRALWCSVETGGTAQWDSDRVEQMLSSLLEHALAHDTPNGAVSLFVRPVREDWVSFEIEVDAPAPDGAGSRPDTLPLVIARHVARAHGGRMVARRAGTEGAQFVVRLPRNHSRPIPKGG